MNLAGEELSANYKPAIWLAGSASAEFFADIALCPFEMAKVKIQTSPTGSFPTAFGAAMKEMSRAKAETRFPFGSLVPLWSRQVSIHATYENSSHLSFTLIDPLHHGQILLFRKDRPALLHSRFHSTQGNLRQNHAARCDFRFRLPRWYCLCHRLSPRRFTRLTTWQSREQGQVHRQNR